MPENVTVTLKEGNYSVDEEVRDGEEKVEVFLGHSEKEVIIHVPKGREVLLTVTHPSDCKPASIV